MYSQFIYGKFRGTEDSGYRQIAYTQDLESSQQLTDKVYRKHYFWSAQGSKGGSAVGIFNFEQNQLILFKVAPAIDEAGKPLISGTRPYYQHHFLLIPKSEINKIEGHVIDLLVKLLKNPSPYFYRLNQTSNPIQNHWKNFTDELLTELSSKDSLEEKAKQIKQDWQEQSYQGKSFFQLALAAIINKQRFILTASQDASSPLDFLENLLFILPAGYRTKISIAIGSVDEQECTWADVIIITRGNPRRNLPEDLIWLNRGSQKVQGNYDNDLDNCRYCQDFIAPIADNNEAIVNFIQYLNEQRDFSDSSDFTDTKCLIDLISGLPKKQQVSLWCKYIPELPLDSEYWQSTSDKYGKNDDFWQGLRQLAQDKSEDLSITARRILSIITLVPEFKVAKLKAIAEDIKENLELAYCLINQGLLELYSPDESSDRLLRDKLIEMFHAGVRYLSNSYLITGKIEDFIRLFDNYTAKLNKSDNYPYLFPDLKTRFNLFDIILEKELEPEVVQVIFNQYFANQIPYQERQIFDNSNLNKQLSKYFKAAKDSLDNILNNSLKGAKHLITLAKMMKMDCYQTDLMYSYFLNQLNPSLENSLPLLEDIIVKAFNDKSLVEKQSVFNPNGNLNNFSQNIQNIRSYQRFKNNSEQLKEILDSLESLPSSWQSWNKFTSFYFKDAPLAQVQFSEQIVGSYFKDELFIKWLKIIQNDDGLIKHFLASHTWNSLEPNIIINLLNKDYKSWTKIIARISLEEFNLTTEKLKLIIPTLFHFLRETYLRESQISEEDENLCSRLTQPNILNYLSNQERLNLLPLKWKLDDQSKLSDQSKSYPPISLSLSELSPSEQNSFYAIAESRFKQLSTFQEKLDLLRECHDLGLSSNQLKKLGIDLIRSCDRDQDVINLMNNCDNLELNMRHKQEIFINVNHQDILFKKAIELLKNNIPYLPQQDN